MSVVAMLCLAEASPAFAAGVRGSVKDPSGGAVASAEVMVLTPARAMIATVRTDVDGRFNVSELAPGSYLVIIRAPLEEQVTVTAAPSEVIDTRRAAQAVNLVSSDEIAHARQHRPRAGGRTKKWASTSSARARRWPASSCAG